MRRARVATGRRRVSRRDTRGRCYASSVALRCVAADGRPVAPTTRDGALNQTVVQSRMTLPLSPESIVANASS